jgi:two-component system nitrogen regulation response regulator GlnG
MFASLPQRTRTWNARAGRKIPRGLFHRLNVIRVHLPPLRERREDIPRLARHFLQVAARELGVEAKQLHPETEAALTRLAWPGNVRQLENTCRWLTVMAAGQKSDSGFTG